MKTGLEELLQLQIQFIFEPTKSFTHIWKKSFSSSSSSRKKTGDDDDDNVYVKITHENNELENILSQVQGLNRFLFVGRWGRRSTR